MVPGFEPTTSGLRVLCFNHSTICLRILLKTTTTHFNNLAGIGKKRYFLTLRQPTASDDQEGLKNSFDDFERK